MSISYYHYCITILLIDAVDADPVVLEYKTASKIVSLFTGVPLIVRLEYTSLAAVEVTVSIWRIVPDGYV